MTMDFHDQFEDVFDIKNGDFLVSILLFQGGYHTENLSALHFSNDYQVKLIIMDYSQEASRDRYCCQFLTIKEISVSLKHFRLQLLWNQHDDEKKQETTSIEWCCWFHLKLGVGIYMLPISCKHEIWLNELTRNFGCLLVSRKGGDIWWIICVFASFLKRINLVPQRTPSFFSKLFEASPGLLKRSTGRGEKRPADRKKNWPWWISRLISRRWVGFPSMWRTGPFGEQSVLRIPNCCNVDLNLGIFCCKGFIFLVR